MEGAHTAGCGHGSVSVPRVVLLLSNLINSAFGKCERHLQYKFSSLNLPKNSALSWLKSAKSRRHV